MSEAEHLSYDVQERAIFDANGLRVASDVSGRDAALFIFADRLRDAALMLIRECDDRAPEAEKLADVLETIAAYEAKAERDGQREHVAAPTRYDLIAEALSYQPTTPWFSDWQKRMTASFGDDFTPGVTMRQLVAEAVAYEAEQFDGPPDTDLSVSGADTVDWLSEWRTRAKAALG